MNVAPQPSVTKVFLMDESPKFAEFVDRNYISERDDRITLGFDASDIPLFNIEGRRVAINDLQRTEST